MNKNENMFTTESQKWPQITALQYKPYHQVSNEDNRVTGGIGLCREPSSRPQDGSLRSRTGGFVDTRPRAVVGKQDGLMPVLGRAA